jgi:hypothetical protein
MGIDLFRFAVLREVLGEDAQRQSTHDLGRAILPGMIGWYRVAAFPLIEGIGGAPAYWRDGSTIDSYWEAHIDLLDPQVDFQLSQSQEPLHAASAQGPAGTLRRRSPRCGRLWRGWRMLSRRRCTLGCGRGGPPLLVDRDLVLRLVETPRVWGVPCQHESRRCPP